jgi:uncharacterized membrane protein
MTMNSPPSAFHRTMGTHAVALRRAIIVLALGLILGVIVGMFTSWQLATVAGWDMAALVYLGTMWPIILRVDAGDTAAFARREDVTRSIATVLLVVASTASLLGVGFALGLAGRSDGSARALLIAVAVLTIALSWALLNTVYTLRYADIHYDHTGQGISFEDDREPNFRDFAYVAFTIGMTYQVSDTALRGGHLRRVVLTHAVLSYAFGVVIVGGAVNLIAGLVR